MIRGALLAIALLFVGGLGFLVQDRIAPGGLGVDDADIYLRYGRNLAAGRGLRWNPSGERVEGCTSLAWTIVAAAGEAWSERPESMLAVTAIACTALAILLAAGIGARPSAGSEARCGSLVFAFAVVAVTSLAEPGFVIWNVVSRLDTGLTTLALTAAAAATIANGEGRWRLAAPLVLALLPWIRPEGSMLALVLSVTPRLFLTDVSTAASRQRRASTTVAIVAASIVALHVFRRLYFGDWLPNTYWAKVGGDTTSNVMRGLGYLAGAKRTIPATAVGVMLALVHFVIPLAKRMFDRPIGRRDRAGFVMSLIVLLQMFATLMVGGDHFPLFRMIWPVWPLIGALLAMDLLLLLDDGAGAVRRARAVFVAMMVIGASLAGNLAGGAPWHRLERVPYLELEFHLPVLGRGVGDALRTFFGDERPIVGVIAAGGLPYAYDGECFDLMGLNDRAMARAHRDRSGKIHGHGAFDVETFLSRPPDVVISPSPLCSWTKAKDASPDFFFDLVLAGIQHDERFRRLYDPVVITTRIGRRDDIGIACYMRKEIAERHAASEWLRRIESR